MAALSPGVERELSEALRAYRRQCLAANHGSAAPWVATRGVLNSGAPAEAAWKLVWRSEVAAALEVRDMGRMYMGRIHSTARDT
jgi:hypothetical protein